MGDDAGYGGPARGGGGGAPPSEQGDNNDGDGVAAVADAGQALQNRGQKSRQDVTMSRPAYWGLVATAIAGIALGAFFGGYWVATTTEAATVTTSDLDDYVTWSQLREMSARTQQQQQAAAGGGGAQGMPVQRPAVSADDDPVIGSPDAPVTIIEFSDFECPFCSRFYHDTLPQIMSTYVETGAVKVVYRDYPIQRIHPNAMITHIAAECADEQDEFWPYHDVLFERQSAWSRLGPADARAVMIEYAKDLLPDVPAFESCLSNPEIVAEIEADRMDGGRYGVTGTPAFFIGNDESGYVLVGGAKSFASFAQVIEQKLES